MSDDGGLVEAVVDRLMHIANGEPKLEWKACLAVAESAAAVAAWQALASQGKGRWAVETDPAKVLDFVIRSLNMASIHTTLHKLPEMTNTHYDELKDAAHILGRHFQEKGGVGQADVECMQEKDAPNESARCAVQIEYIMGRLHDDEKTEMQAVESLPRPGCQGRGARARTFAICLSTFLKQQYGRPFDDFVMTMTTLFHEDEADLVDVGTLTKHRGREEKRRSKAQEEQERYLATVSTAGDGDTDLWLTLPVDDGLAPLSSSTRRGSGRRIVP